MTNLYLAASLLAALLAWLTVRYSLLLPPVRGLPVLMYHQFDPQRRDRLTVSTAQFEEQLAYLKAQGYTSLSCADLVAHLQGEKRLPARPVMITLDDGYQSQLQYAYPVLKKFAFKATIFVPTKYIGQTAKWNDSADAIVSEEQIRTADPEVIQWALHSHAHENYRRMSLSQIAEDLRLCMAELTRRRIAPVPALAYPYGGFPRERVAYGALQTLLELAGVEFAFRIGNRVNRLPLTDRYALKRIDVQGLDSPWAFRTKLRKGRVRMF